jgi:membrane-associated phospholipid phosphatase
VYVSLPPLPFPPCRLRLRLLPKLTFPPQLHHVPVAARRTFPITFNSSGDIVNPDLAYPNRGWIIETWLSGVLSALVPIIAILLIQIRVRSLTDATNAITGVLYADILGTLFQIIVKKLIGGFRPYFLDQCQPDISLIKGKEGGLNAVGYQQMYYSIDVCTTPDKKKLEQAISSFPSGHAVAAFAGFGFLFLYMNAKFKVWSDHRPQMWKLGVVFAPLLCAFLISCSLSIDAAHNWYDIVVGIILGTAFAFGNYRFFYAAIWDWRFNHIPLLRKEYAYAADGYDRTSVFTTAGGWGRRGAAGEKTREAPSARSSTTVSHGLGHLRDHRGSHQRATAEEVV